MVTKRIEPAPTTTDDESEGLELKLGRVWFVRIGIGFLLTGFVFLSTYAYQNFIIHWPAGIRVAALYLLAALLTLVDRAERLVILEDTSELPLGAPHVVRLEARPPTADHTDSDGNRVIRDPDGFILELNQLLVDELN